MHPLSQLLDHLRLCVPSDGTLGARLSGRLHVIVTRLYPLGRPLWVVSDFDGADDLCQASSCGLR